MNQDAVQNERQPRNSATIQLTCPPVIGDISSFYAANNNFFRNIHSSSVSTLDFVASSANVSIVALETEQKELKQATAFVEASKRILFAVIKGVKSMPPFSLLPFTDQKKLLETTWADLFVMALIQCSTEVSNGQIICEGESVQHYVPLLDVLSDSSATFIPFPIGSEIKKLVHRFRRVALDPGEWACLRACIVFRPEILDLKNTSFVEELQEQALLMLHEHSTHHHDSSLRFGRILLLISPLQTFTSASNTLENVFFQQSGIVNSMVAKCIKEYEDEY